MSPILRSILEAGAAYPMMRELLAFAKLDQDKPSEKAQAALGQLTGELGTILKKEEQKNGEHVPSAGANIAEATGDEQPKAETPAEVLEVQRAIADKLDAILAELKAGRAVSGS